MRGTMSEMRPGVWRLRVVDRYDEQGRPHQLSRTVYGNKRSAQSALAQFVAEVHGGVAPTSGAMTYGDYLAAMWLPHVRATTEPTTYETHMNKVRRRIIPTLGHIQLAKLTPAHLDRAYRRWEQELAPSTARSTAATVSASLAQAVKWGLVARNVAQLATRRRVPQRKPTLPSLEQVCRLVEQAERDDPTLAVVVLLAAVTGLRRSELAGLQWRDLDTELLTLHVQRAVKRVTGRTIVGEPKTHRSRRISLDRDTVDVLLAHRARMAQLGKAAPSDFMFAWGAHDKPASPMSLTGRFERLAKRVGVRCRLHDLRHAVASHLLSEGVDVATVSRRLGHSSPAVTLRVYAHALESADRAAAGVMSGLLAGARREPAALAAPLSSPARGTLHS